MKHAKHMKLVNDMQHMKHTNTVAELSNILISTSSWFPVIGLAVQVLPTISKWRLETGDIVEKEYQVNSRLFFFSKHYSAFGDRHRLFKETGY